MDPIYFDRKPYFVTYKDFRTNETVRIKRRPPEKLHEILPTDIVELKVNHGDNWEEGSSYAVKHISNRSPNILQIEDKEDDTTFIPYYEVELKQKVAYRGRTEQQEDPGSNRYLLWPWDAT